jgi:DNA polymerase III delta subunit
MNVEQLFQLTAQGKLPPVLFIYGSDGYLRREWKKLVEKQGFEVAHKDLKKKGPESADEDLSHGTSLFSQRSMAWLETQAPFKKWSAESLRIWKRMEERADGQGFALVCQCPSFSEKRSLKDNEVSFDLDPMRLAPWIQRMNQSRGSPLAAAQLRFLETLNVDLLSLDNSIELWSLGGDAWAREALGWGRPAAPGQESNSPNPAFEWVEAVIAGERSVALKALKALVREGEDPIRLLGLLNRSLKIYVTLEMGLPMGNEAPFLIDKVRRLAKKNPRSSPDRGKRLLEETAQADAWLKSRPVDGDALLARLSEIT